MRLSSLKLPLKLSSLVAMLFLLVSLQGPTTAASPPYCNPSCFAACEAMFNTCARGDIECCNAVNECTDSCGFCPILC